ncbi:MFS transporter [Pseudoduganella chitinolytica]|uniref:MFS transporter n=1 Tax=Pseudoduganella chitinolytica TaxID=34070 RepID=A0ABY8BEE8_9BURK|nr:MFS transporter [Pseudoduganella chitinolytica]WEF34277.1 MFS transporter [Pseudoduganella chitinolytica]
MTGAGAPRERLVHVLFALQLVSMGAMEMSGPFWPVHLRALTGSEALFGFAAVAVYVGPMLGIVLTSTFWGRVGDRHGHQLMMIRALLGLALTQLALAHAADVWSILVLRFVQGACAGYIAPAQAYGVGITAPERRARLFAYLQVATNVGSLAGAVAGGAILDHASFYWINVTAALLCGLCAAAVAVCLPRQPAAAPGAGPRQPAAASSDANPAALPGLLLVLGLLLVSRTITQTPFALYVHETFGAANWLAGLCYGLLALGFVLSAALWARHFERRPQVQVLRRMTWIALGCAVLMAAAAGTRSIGVFAALHLAWGVLLGATTPVLMALVSKAAGTLRQGHVLGTAQSITQFSSIAGIALGGLLMQRTGLQYTYCWVALAYVLAALAVYAVRRATAPHPLGGNAHVR